MFCLLCYHVTTNHFITFNNLTLWETLANWKMMPRQIEYAKHNFKLENDAWPDWAYKHNFDSYSWSYCRSQVFKGGIGKLWKTFGKWFWDLYIFEQVELLWGFLAYGTRQFFPFFLLNINKESNCWARNKYPPPSSQ